MKSKFYQSLRFKIMLHLLLPLLGILAVFSYLQYAHMRELLLDNIRLSATNAGEIIESSLQYAMLTNDFSAIRQSIDDITKQQGVRDLLLLDREGKVIIASRVGMVGTVIDIQDPTCQACHQYAEASRNENVVLTLPEGERVFRNANAIENAPSCQACHPGGKETIGLLITDLSMADIDRQLAANRRGNLLWEGGSILFIMLLVSAMTSSMVIKPLEHFVRAIKRISEGDLTHHLTRQSNDEIGELASAFNHMVDELKEKQTLEQQLQERTQELQAQADRLSTLNSLAATVSQSLNLHEILQGALQAVMALLKMKAGSIVLKEGQDGQVRLAASLGIPEEMLHDQGVATQEGCICREMMEGTEPRILSSAASGCELPCVDTEYLAQEQLTSRVCIPLKSKDRVLGLMVLDGDAASHVETLSQDTREMLMAIGRQIGIAVENASLYEELRQTELLRRQLLARVITAQEEERKRISRELHDETSQALTSLIVKLKVLAEADSMPEVRKQIEGLREATARTLEEVHDLALDLRPSVLDDLGLVAALRHYLRDYRNRYHLPVDLQVLGLDDQQLPPQVATALYRIVQEALTNIARHAQARSASVLLQNRGNSLLIIIEDDGQGFDVTRVMGSGQGTKTLGLYGIRERASLLGGTVTIESTPGTGTAIFVEIPLAQEKVDGAKDPSVVSR